MLTRLRGRLTQCQGITIEVRPMAQHELDFIDVMYFGDEEAAETGHMVESTEPESEPPGDGGTILSAEEVAARMNREGRSRMTMAETEAILPGRISVDDAEAEEAAVELDENDPKLEPENPNRPNAPIPILS